MPISIIQILFTLFDISNSNYSSFLSLLYQDDKFSINTESSGYIYSGYFSQPSSSATANFITCTTPPTSYITLSQNYPSTKYHFYYLYRNGDWISMDVYFQSTWSSQNIQFTLGSFSYSYTYTSPTTYTMSTGFCDTTLFEVKTLNFTLQLAPNENTVLGQINFASTNTDQGLVSLRNIHVSRIQCYPSCASCTGSQYNQCTECFYGLPTNNICPPCPPNQYYQKNEGCNDICDLYTPFYSEGFCQSYKVNQLEFAYCALPVTQAENLKWQLIYDIEHLDTSPTIMNIFPIPYGIFKFNSGIFRQFNCLSTYLFSTYLIGLQIQIIVFNDIPINCGIQFKINNTYYGSIYRNTSGIQTHIVKIGKTFADLQYLTYSTTIYQLILYIDIPKYAFIFSAIGNYTDSTAGWGMSKVYVSSGYCSQYCKLCEVSFKCKTGQTGYYYYRNGMCIGSCYQAYQKSHGWYCQDYDDETPYSEFLVKEYMDLAGDPEQYAQYSLISQSGSNFLKGSDIYFSYWNGYRVFGGPYVWAQAKFQRIHNIISPHHSVTIAFYIIYGPQFPSDGKFIYTIENNTPVSKSTTSPYPDYFQGSIFHKIYEKINHNINTLRITWECFGPNNEPIYAYCGFYNYYIAVHKCQPYCLQCSDQFTCTQWNSTYDSSIIKFSSAECLNNKYYDKDSLKCLDCPQSCLTCTSKLDCQTCSSTYTQSKLGCTCTINQYEESNQCFDCPIECNQCLNINYCIECLTTNNRQFSDGKCICIEGYYPIPSNPQCQLCHQFCKTCIGPTSDECLTCNNIVNIEQVGSTCRCPAGKSYEDAIKTCSSCHSSCLTCFRITINGCLTCDSTLKRILKGLKCVCAPGYYELNNICTICPTIVDSTLSQCYKLCNNNQLIWHTTTCSSCDTGFQLVSGECQPICGDSLIKGYEQCEDNNTLLNDLCYNCQFQCPIQCLTCDLSTSLPCPDVCGDGMITGTEECEDGNTIQYDGCFNCKYQCSPGCTRCIKGQCFECVTVGWEMDLTVTPFKCKERCGDLLIVGSEQCEDQNTSDLDGCKDCRYFCRIGCSSCDYTTNTCLSCQSPGLVPTSYYCQNVCGDGLVAVDPSGIYTEQCDDGNTSNNDGCSSSCQFQCQPTTICTSCINNRCETCAPEYQLSNEKICIPICGDSIFVVGEQCESSYVLPYKGCQNCQAKCQNSCLSCDTTGLGCLECQPGYKRINYLCYSICGDKIVTEDEQCDDGNLIYDDGCHFCQFSCQDSCLNCLKGICFDCQEGYQLILSKCYSICGDGLQKYKEQCDIITSLQIYQNCQSCQFTCDLNCYLCQFAICQQCNDGYELSSNQNYCVKSLEYNFMIIENCGIQIGSSCIKCENYAYFEKAEQKCNLQVAPLSFCQYQLKLSPDLYCSYCFDYCATCNENNCIDCQNGYYLDENFSCISFCGDGILAHDEQCEIYDDNCLSCEFDAPKLCELYFKDQCLYLDQNTSTCIIDYNMNKCFKNCKLCVLSKCLECEFGYYGNKCMPKCGDGIIVQEEECDDGSEYQLDTCLNCQYQCPQYCNSCAFGICTNCFSGFYLDIVSNSCNSDCGDQILASDEVCDDGNQLGYDGCFECKYQCQIECLDCQFGKCIECELPLRLGKSNGVCEQQKSCEDLIGLYYDNQSNDCLPQCGDGIVAGNEYCDDENNVPYDGCYECKFQCIQYCQECKDNICFECDKDYTLDNNQCILNGEYDDHNSSINEVTQKNDQSSNNNTSIYGQNPEWSSLNENMICRENECVYSKKPSMKLTYKLQSFALQYVEITFDQEVKFRDQVEKGQSLFDISINDLDSKQYNITINSIQDISFDLQYAQYQVQIEIFLQLQTKPVLLVQLNQEIVNSNNQTLVQPNQSITLQATKIMSKQLKQVSTQAYQSNKVFMIGAISICVISFVSGESSFVVETLNLLQYQSFLRFINIDFPENLQIYFQAQELLSISNYLQFFQIDDYLNLITRKEQQIDLNGKLQQYNIEADLFTNILPQMIQCVALVTLIQFSEKLFYILFGLRIYMKQLQNKETIFQKIQFTMIKLILVFQNGIKQLMKTKYLQNYDLIIQLIYINSWDLIFKVILQLNYIQIDNLRSILSTFSAGLIFFSFIGFLLKSFNLCSNPKEKKFIAKLNIKFIALDVFRTTIFHIFLILFQEQQILQCLLIFISSITYCYIIYQYKQCSCLERIISLINEGALTLFSLSLFLYFDIDQVYISYENKVTLGFIQMAFLIMSLGIVFAEQLFFKIKLALRLICNKKDQKFSSSKLFL